MTGEVSLAKDPSVMPTLKALEKFVDILKVHSFKPICVLLSHKKDFFYEFALHLNNPFVCPESGEIPDHYSSNCRRLDCNF